MLCWMASPALAQLHKGTPATLYLMVKNSAGKPVQFTRAWLMEDSSGIKQENITDKNGRLQFTVGTGYHYYLSFTGAEKYADFNVPIDKSLTIIQKITYDPTTIRISEYDTLRQQNKENVEPRESESMITIKLTDRNDAVSGVGEPIRIKCIATHTVYLVNADKSGKAIFIVPPGHKYHLGIEQLQDINTFDMPKEGGMMVGYTLTYVPTHINETAHNDTFTQQLPVGQGPTTARRLVDLTVIDMDGNALPNEPVYLKRKDKSTIYTCTTDAAGHTAILLPKGYQYSVNFKYESNLDVLDVKEDGKLASTKIQYRYMGSENIENFYKQSKRNKEGFITEFMEMKIEKLLKLPEITKEKKEYGYDLVVPDGNDMCSPGIFGDHMLMTRGLNGREIYCYNKEQFTTEWGLSLAEAGPSSLVYIDNVVLCNTESCSIYAVDASNGKLLWAKWLSPYLYTTPSVLNGHIYTVYGNDLPTPDGKSQRYVLICFDLHTGKILWQNWINSEVIGSPVCVGKNVYISCRDGSIMAFDANIGKQLGSRQVSAVTMPMIYRDMVYVSCKIGKGDQEQVMVYNADNLKDIKKFSQLKGKLYHGMADLGPVVNMSYDGSRMLNYNGKNYNVMDSILYCSDIETGNILWKATIAGKMENGNNGQSSMPIATAGKIIVGSEDGNVYMFNPDNGKIINTVKTTNATWAQPCINNGWIFIGSKNGRVTSINTGNPKLTGWNMWGKDPSHNTVVE